MSKLVNWIEFNPKVQLKKDEEYPFVTMDYLKPGTRYVNANEKRKFTGGGAKFQSGDTLFARITPCLENGKIAQFVDENAINGAFGSTEFFVLRAIPGKSNPAFVYYLSQTNLLRETAIKSMVGASGRQRAEINVLKELEIEIPSLKEQTRIAAILSAYDDLIANNRRRMQLLETAARRLYRHHFAPASPKPRTGHWAVLGEVAEITMGQSPESKHYNLDGEGLPFHQGVSDFGSRFVSHKVYTRNATRIAQPGDILCSVRAPVGRLNVTHEQIAIGRGLSALRSLNGHQSLLFYQLDNFFVKEDMIGSGTIFASVTKKELTSQKIFQPDFENAEKFNRIASAIDAQIANLDKQNHLLTRTRDALLPRLMQPR